MIPETTLQAVRAKAELLNGGASLGESGDLLAEIAVQKALAYCQRRDVPEDMEQAAAALLLALYSTVPRSGDASAGTPEDGGEAAGDSIGDSAADSAGGASGGYSGEPDWEALIAAGAVKSVQRGDTAVTFNTSAAGAAVSAALSASAAHPTVEAALAGLAPWRRLGRLKEEEAGRGD